jgi:hypothetical protein
MNPLVSALGKTTTNPLLNVQPSFLFGLSTAVSSHRWPESFSWVTGRTLEQICRGKSSNAGGNGDS